MATEAPVTSEKIRTPASRTAPCPCGSGRRYKDCHGTLAAANAAPDASVHAHQLALQALGAQQRMDLTQAKTLYEQALALDPNHADALHMLGVVLYELGDATAAVPLIVRALDLSDWAIPSMRNNLGLALVKLSRGGAAEQYGLSDKGREYRARLANEHSRATVGESAASRALVSVVVPIYNHAAYVREALESVYAQTYRNIELIVIDDGSTDDSAAIAREALSRCPFPHRFVARENRGAHATLNEAIALSTGTYINPLNSDDVFATTRIESLVAALLRHNAALALSSLSWIDAQSTLIDPFADARVYALTCKQSGVAFHDTVGSALLTHNVAATTGNLCFSRELFDALGGFRDFRYNHDWDFCLRALWLTEPLHIDQPLYRYRFHGQNTISESADKPRAEAMRVLSEYLERAFDPDEIGMHYTPNVAQWRDRFVTQVLSNGLAVALAPDIFKTYAQRMLAAQ
jgi:glycosyltransferase involved in cell wall biosynthesis